MSTYYYVYPTCKISQKACLQSCCWGKLGIKGPTCPKQQQGPLLEISYIPLLSVMRLHYHRLYQIKSLEPNLSLEDMRQLCRKKPPSQVYLPQN